MNGWIKIHRKLCEHWIWGNPVYLKWWLDLIMLANHKPVTILINGNLATIEQGMYHTSILSLSGRWSANRKTVNTFLKLLEDDFMITTEKSKRDGTTINICNYAAYQDFSVDTWSSNGHRKSTFDEKNGKKNASKNIKNETRSKADVCADTQDFSTLEGQPAGQPEGQLTGQPTEQPEGHKQELKNDKKKDQHLCSTELSGCDQVEPAVTDNILSGNVDGKRRGEGKQAGYVLPQHLQETFDIFWAAYPKKRNKGDAKKAWEKIQPNRELLTNMLTSLERAKTCLSWTKDNGQYVPYPASWLRAEGWEDEIKTLTTQPKPLNDRRRET